MTSAPNDDADHARAQTSRALRSLTFTQRRVLELAYFDRLTQPEIARRLSMPLALVRSTAATGLRRLSSAIESDAEPRRSAPRVRDA